jgi:hypothetical protein
MSERPNCVDCQARSPKTKTHYTLISADFGWRLSRRTGPEGQVLVEWRCPVCWRLHKKARTEAVGKPTAK